MRPSRCGFDGVRLLSLVKPRGCVVVLCQCQQDELLQYAPSQMRALDILSENTLTSSGSLLDLITMMRKPIALISLDVELQSAIITDNYYYRAIST